MFKRIMTILLAIVFCLPLVFGVVSASSDAREAATKLNSLGLFNGVGINAQGDPEFALDRTPTRAEAVTMLVRLIGKETEALSNSSPLPFTDVPEWAIPYVSFAYRSNLALGVNEETFSSNRAVTASEYITFILSALGYTSGADFEWDKAWILSDEIGITGGRYNDETAEFLRGDIAVISFNALSARLKGLDRTLSSLLIDANVFTYADAKAAGVGVIDDTAVPMAERAAAPDYAPTPGASQLEREVFILINNERLEYGLEALDWDAKLADVARAPCDDMVKRKYFSHISPDGLRPVDRKRAAGIYLRYSAENIAQGYKSSEAVVAAWMASPPHRSAILADAPSIMGVGFVDNFWAVNFVGY